MTTVTTAAINSGSTHAPNAPRSKSTLLSDDNYRFLQQEIYRDSGIVLDEDKHYLLDARLTPLVREAKLASLDDLCASLRAHTSLKLARQVMEALTTNETLFFRDMAPFEALRALMLPELLKNPSLSGRPLRIWSAAASSGQEAYSIAMVLRELAMQARSPMPVVHILGTDISEQILATAREGKYVQFEVNRGLPAVYLVKYFNRIGGDWQLKDEIRAMATFRPFDLRQPMAVLGRFQIIFCRNVLIYFDVATKTKILKQIATVLDPGGFLVLGGAESIMTLQDSFERVPNTSTAIYRRKDNT